MRFYNFGTNFKYNLKTKFNKSFIIFMVVVFIFAAIATNIFPIINLFTNDNDSQGTIYLYSASGTAPIVDSLNSDDLGFSFAPADTDDFTTLNTEENEYLINLDTAEIYGTTSADTTLNTVFTTILQTSQLQSLSSELGLTAEQLSQINSAGEYTYEQIKVNADGEIEEDNGNFGAFYVVATIISVASFIILIYTIQFLGNEILEEKSSRAMELIITNTSPFAHLFAKVLSTLLYVLAFILTIIVSLVINAYITSLIFDIKLDIVTDVLDGVFQGIELSHFILFLVSLLILLFITLFIALFIMGAFASTASNLDEYNKVATPVTFLIMTPYLLSYIPVIPALVMKILAFIPIFSLFNAPTLYLHNDITLTFYILVIISQLIILILIMYVSTKIYRVGVLNYSDQPFRKIVASAIKRKKKAKQLEAKNS